MAPDGLGGTTRLAILSRKCLWDSPSRPGSGSVGPAPGEEEEAR